VDCVGDDQRPTRAQISLQYSGNSGELELGAPNATQRVAAALESKREKANAIN